MSCVLVQDDFVVHRKSDQRVALPNELDAELVGGSASRKPLADLANPRLARSIRQGLRPVRDCCKVGLPWTSVTIYSYVPSNHRVG